MSMAKAKTKRKGRRKGSRNRGYFFVKDRGWVANINRRRVPLEYENGDRMRDESTRPADVKAAYFEVSSAHLQYGNVAIRNLVGRYSHQRRNKRRL
jgi:hypothetical protein